MRSDEEAARPILEQIARESRDAQLSAADPKAGYLLLRGSREIAAMVAGMPPRLVSQTLSDSQAGRIENASKLFGEIRNTDAAAPIKTAAHDWFVKLQMLL